MTEATEKQVKFATSLGIDNPIQYSKEALKELIAIEVDKREDKIDSTPQKPGKVVETSPKGGYHLTPEQVNTNALEIAINFNALIENKPTIGDVIELGKQVKAFISS